MIAAIVRGTAAIVGEREACVALGVSRSSYRRWATPACTHPTRPRSGGRALSTEEREHVLATMHEPRFADLPVPQIYAMLLAEGVHLCSPRTMYRILDAVGENVERRNVRHYVASGAPALAHVVFDTNRTTADGDGAGIWIGSGSAKSHLCLSRAT